MEIVILAGGKGTRMGDQTKEIPKPMMCIGNKPILLHIMDYYLRWGATKFIICCGYKQEYIKQYFEKLCKNSEQVDDITTRTIYEKKDVLLIDTGIDTGTAGRIATCIKYIEENNFYLTYGDGLSDVDISKLTKEHLISARDITLSAVNPQERFGIIQFDGDNKVIDFQEKSKRTDVWINGGFMIVDRKVFNHIREDDVSFEYDVLPRLVKEGVVGAYKHYGFWQCMDTEDEKKKLEHICRQEKKPWLK